MPRLAVLHTQYYMSLLLHVWLWTIQHRPTHNPHGAPLYVFQLNSIAVSAALSLTATRMLQAGS